MEFTESTVNWLHLDNSNPEQGRLYVSTEHRADPAVQSDIARALRQYPQLNVEHVHLGELRRHQLQRAGVSGTAGSWSPEQNRVVDFMRRAGEAHASDIHILIGMENLTAVVFRIHGDLALQAELSIEEGMSLAATIVMSMCDAAPQQFSETDEQDGRLRNEFMKALGLYAARYSAVPTESGLYVVLRVILDESEDIPSLDVLGYLPEQQKLIRRMLRRPEGLIITAGPTGSGKSTTMRTLCQMYLELTGGKRRLITVEDPVEGKVPGAVQTTIIADRNDPDSVTRAWQRRLSALKRLDYNAAVVGEIRDTWSANASISEAKSGTLVETTTHANDATGIIDRLTDTLGIAAGMVMDPQVVIGLIAQRLVQTLCPACKKSWADVRDTLAMTVEVASSVPAQAISKQIETMQATLSEILAAEQETGTAVVQSSDRTTTAITEAARTQREADNFNRQTDRLEKARASYTVPDSICSESASGTAAQVSQATRAAASKLAGGTGVSSAAVRETLASLPTTPRQGGYRSALIHAAYCTAEEAKLYGGTGLCPGVSSLPGGDTEARSLYDGAGQPGKSPELTFTQEQTDAAMAYVNNSAKLDAGRTPGRGEIQTATGQEYQGLLTQYKAMQSAAMQPQLDMVAASQPQDATQALTSVYDFLANALQAMAALHHVRFLLVEHVLTPEGGAL